MQIVETYTSSKAVHPATLKTCRAIFFRFSSGHTMTRYEGGLESFANKAGRALNQKSGAHLISQMRALVA